MPLIGFHASHELFPPSALLRHVQRAERAGFRAAMCSDHFHPWTPEQGQSGYSFAWLSAALQATTLTMGTICCPHGRYNVAVVAQAAATLAEMFPDRFWLAVGTGESLNEHITGEAWPEKEERQSRLREAVEIMRALWAGETVTHRGRIHLDRARLYSRPTRPPLLLGAAITPQSAEWVSSWADGLLTVNGGAETLRSVVDAFDNGGRPRPKFLQSMLGYDTDEERAWQAAARSWPIAALDSDATQNLATPEQFAAATKGVSAGDLKGKLRVSSDLNRHIDWLRQDAALGFDRIFIYTISGEQERFIDAFGEKAIPALADA